MHEFLSTFLSGPLAIHPGELARIRTLEPRAAGIFGADRPSEPYDRIGRLAHFAVSGPIAFGGGPLAFLFGMVDSEELADAIHRAADDDTIEVGLLDIHSPGGSVAGMNDLVSACEDFRAAGKRLVAVAHDAALSGGLWLACQADELYVTPQAMVGSIGAMRYLVDESGAFERDGRRAVLIASTEIKGTGAPGVPVGEVQIAKLKDPVMEWHRQFVEAVAAGRGVSTETVEGWAQELELVGERAVDAGLADGVVAFRDLLGELAGLGDSVMPTNRKSARAVATAAGKARAAAAGAATATATEAAAGKAEGAEEEDAEQLRARIEELEQENEELRARAESTEEEEEEATASATASATPSATAAAPASLAEIKAALTENGRLTDAAKACAFDAFEMGMNAAQASALWARTKRSSVDAEVTAEAATADRPAETGGKTEPETGDYMAMVKSVAAEKNITMPEAVAVVNREHPELRKAYVAAAG